MWAEKEEQKWKQKRKEKNKRGWSFTSLLPAFFVSVLLLPVFLSSLPLQPVSAMPNTITAKRQENNFLFILFYPCPNENT